ncbi:glycosyltransferase family 2 protein [Solirhodobacter olei]|uniref:glycosyltransferase family 2 protein n=1 Tax=Solirhodobacter olei TaxID=2493082 RepID=UPI000FDAD686|nr:glycosyltransferase family 2 protein [Solirhodobacter olei]
MIGAIRQTKPAGALLTVIIPANNEEGYIGRCLEGLLGQDKDAGLVEIIVSGNGCTDRTEEIVRAAVPAMARRGWNLIWESRPELGKFGALNWADRRACGAMRIYLDADVQCEPALLGQLRKALGRPGAVYATGTIAVAPARSWITRRYSAVWSELPFVVGGAVGAGLFAVNAAGRERWREFPEIISDDTFVRLQFSPEERIEVPARYHWPMVEGFRNLVRVRRRQNAGVAEIRRLYPEIMANEGKVPLSVADLLTLALRRPIGFALYVLVQLAVRLGTPTREWSRGR